MTGSLPPIRLPGGRVVPERALQTRSGTAQGPGGQHVNRTQTRVEITIDLAQLPLNERERELVHERLGTRISRGGTITVGADERRSQLRNRIAARDRLERLLKEALALPTPRTPTRPSRSQRLKRRVFKERTSERKRNRRPPGPE